jgi:hypothetical protein
VNAITEQRRKTALPLIVYCTWEHCNGMNADAPIARPCKLTNAGKIGSGAKTAKDTKDSLKDRVCNEIDFAETCK